MSEQLKRKLLDYEVSPPPDSWEFIAGNLQENKESFHFAKKMYEFEVEPPQGLLTDILTAVNSLKIETAGLPIKTVRKRMPHLVAAATVFGIVLMGSLYLIYNNSSKKLISGTVRNAEKKSREDKESADSSIDGIPEITQPEVRHSASIGSIASVYANQKEKKNYDRVVTKEIYSSMVNIARTLTATAPITIAARPIRNAKGDIIQDPKLINTAVEKYISITGPNGQQTKISSKFMNVLLYLNGDSDIEDIDGYFDKSFLESLIWKSRFKDWREKIMQTSYIPTSTNFMDILEFKDLILNDSKN